MGKITFQAALGGSVDLVGPNTATAVTLNLPTASGNIVGTGSTGIVTTAMISGQIAVAQGGTGVSTSTGTGSVVLNTSPTLVTPALGTPASGVLTNATGLPLTTGVTGILPVANGGSGTATPALVAGTNVSITGTWPNQTINSTASGSGSVTSVATGTGLTGGPITTTGTIALANTAVTPGTYTAANITIDAQGRITAAANGSGGGGGTVTSVSVVSANGFTGTVATASTTPAITLTTSITGLLKGNGTAISAATAGTDYLTPGGALGTPSSGTLTNATGLPLTTGVTGTLAVANGGTGVTVSSGANSVVLRDSDVNVSSNNFNAGWTSTTLSTTLVSLQNASSYYQEFTGAIAGQVVRLPYGPTAVLGQSYIIINNGSFQLDLKDASGVQIITIYAGGAVRAVCKTNSGSSGNWQVSMLVPSTGPSGLINWNTSSLEMGGSGISGISTFGLSGQLTSTVTTGTAPFVVSSTTPVANLNIGGNAATATTVTGTVAVANGGTGLTTTPANGALDIGNGTGFTRTTLTAGSGVSITNASGSITIAATGSGGTVTSVTGTSPVVSSGGTTPAISLATAYGDTLNPYASKTANYVLAAPNGTAGVPSFRALVAADIPTLNQNTTGTAANVTATSNATLTTLSVLSLPGSQVTGNISGNAANVTGTVAIANGGTGQTTAAAGFNALSPITTAGDLILGNGTNSATRLGIGANGYVLTSNGTTASWAAASSGSGTVTSITAGTGLTGGTITTSGTIALATTAVTAASYTSANITVDAYGRITAAANGSSGGASAYTRTSFTATSGQTAFTVTYAVGYLQVYLNGVLLATSDYTATSGTGFTLAVGANTGDIVEALVITTSISTTGGLSWQAVQTANFTATSGNAYPVNTTAGAITVTLPASPTAGNLVTIVDYAGTASTNNITINPNGNKIQGLSANSVINANRQSCNFVYLDATQGWISYAQQYSSVGSLVSVEYLTVAGGGGGGYYNSGGGGAGGYKNSTSSIVLGTSYLVTVGAGGAGATSAAKGVSGSSSIFSSITSTGGGGGGSGGSIDGVAGGSGGGGAAVGSGTAGAGGAASPSGQGNAGGIGANTANYGGGGGGGASAAGANATGSNGGNGGAGSANSISGTSVTYAGGGGGGIQGSTAGTGGSGGGGNGSNSVTTGGSGTANTGGGGGGAGYTGAPGSGGSGGSGIVIVAYVNTYPDISAFTAGLTVNGTTTTGSNVPAADTSSRSGYKVYKFTAGTGTFTF